MTEQNAQRIDAEALVREALAGAGSLRLAFLLQRLVPLDSLRDVVRRHGLSVKGFRVERAPAERLAPVLAEATGAPLDEACALLARALGGAPAAEPVASASRDRESVSVSVHRAVEQQRDLAQRALDGMREQSERHRRQAEELRRQLEAEREGATRLNARIRELERARDAAPSSARAAASPDDGRVRALERDLETLGEAEVGLRRLLALRETRLREAEAQIVELEALVPKGRRRRKPAIAESDGDQRFRVPHLTESFYRSFSGKERSSIERALRAVFTFCSEGPSYPGLEVKQIEGQDLWSLRASLKLRVYFRNRDDGDFDVLALADREDQHTALRRLKER